MLSRKELRELFDYHPGGYLIRKKAAHRRYPIGSVVKGSVHRTGNLVVTIAGKQYPLRSLIWVWHTGQQPRKLEFIDDDQLNCRIENLREYKSRAGQKVTQEELKRLFCYDIDTGELKWIRSQGGAKKGDVVGYVQNGYRKVVVNKASYPAANLVLLYLENLWPREGETVDHIDRDRGNNRRENLRIVNRRVQQINRGLSVNSKTGITGVTLTPSGGYRVYISVDGMNRQIGKPCHDFDEAVYRRYKAEEAAGWHSLNSKTPAKLYVEKHDLIKKFG